MSLVTRRRLVTTAVTLLLMGYAAPAHAVTTNPSTAPVLKGINLERATVPELQRAMDAGRLSSVELTALYLDRIRRLNPRLHAITGVNPDALRAAAESDRIRRRHGARSALEGIPVLLKDNIDTADRQPSTAGSLALTRSTPAADAHLAARLRTAGAVLIGKANLSEWANFRASFSSSGWSAVGGQTNNPYVLDRNPCGSSSGSAVGAAAHLATLTVGTETDGSIVCPAGHNSVVGVKPTLGLVSRTGVVPISARQDTAGPITRTVTDAAVLLTALQGVDRRDPDTIPAAPYVNRDYLRALRPDGARGKRIGVWRLGSDNPAITRVLDATVATLRERGATVVDNVTLPGIDDVSEPEFAALLHEFKHDINGYLARRPAPHPGSLTGLIDFNRRHADTELRYFDQALFEAADKTSGDLTDPAYRATRARATGIAQRAIDSALATHRLDAIVAPTNNPAWLTDLAKGDDFTGFVGSSTPAAVAGYPNLTVPAGFANGALPLGVSFFAGRWSEPTLLAIGYAHEQASRARTPPRFLPTLP